jgi:hypothetical protein
MAVKMVESTRRMIEDLDLKFLGRFVEHALRALALFQHALDRRARAHHHLDGGVEDRRQLVDHREVGRIRDHDDQRAAVATVRHEAVAQHQVGRNRSEQFLINPELVHVEELEPVAIRQAPRRGHFRGAIRGRNLRSFLLFD